MTKRNHGRDIHGILLLDKRLGVSSNRALQEVKRLYNANKAGHTGSLDPLATGLLPICLGAATKISGLMLNDHKRYQVSIQLGIATDTGDLEGNVIATKPVPALTDADLQAVLKRFTGAIEQIPPMYSALKQNGKKLYELARAGRTVERAARSITIFEINCLKYHEDTLELEVHCSKGTYIRTLSEDIGQALGTCATVKALRRINTGGFRIEQAISYDDLANLNEQALLGKLLAVDAPLSALPAVNLNTQEAASVKQGQQLKLNNEVQGTVRMYCANEFLGLGEMRLDGKLAPKKIFCLTS
ncbi:MAG: tRNA pseudouridine(55) synthase TruB [Gammaproteobacteria bacterium]|nr:tRNA pseudouridine(55) synthase TruB [Gammaproteobacteria bacterium]